MLLQSQKKVTITFPAEATTLQVFGAGEFLCLYTIACFLDNNYVPIYLWL